VVGGEGDRRGQRGARGLAARGRRARADHRLGALARRPQPVPVQLAPRRPARLRRVRPGPSSVRRSGWAGCSAATAAIRRPPGRSTGGRRCSSAHWTASACTSATRSTRPGTTSSIPACAAKLDRQPDGTYALDPDFFVDFHEQAEGARPDEIHLPGGDYTTEIFQ
jgi:hypothetical protein